MSLIYKDQWAHDISKKQMYEIDLGSLLSRFSFHCLEDDVEEFGMVSII